MAHPTDQRHIQFTDERIEGQVIHVATSAYGLPSGRDRALATYRVQSVETASPGELVLMLYNECLRAMRNAAVNIDRKDIPGASACLMKAQDVILELRGSLNAEAGGDLAKNLDSIYDYAHTCLIEANIKKAQQPLADSMKVISELRDAWAEALHKHGG